MRKELAQEQVDAVDVTAPPARVLDQRACCPSGVQLRRDAGEQVINPRGVLTQRPSRPKNHVPRTSSPFTGEAQLPGSAQAIGFVS